MITDDIKNALYGLQDLEYRDFQSNLLPTVPSGCIIGVRTPELRKLAKQFGAQKSVSVFLNALPHDTFDENQLHAFIISGIKDYEECLKAVDAFLPYVDNWATCDQMSPRVFKKHRQELLEPVRRWLASDHTYTVRFGVGMLMEHFLDEDFDPAYLRMAADVSLDEYYVRMMVAWYFATALAKQYEAALPFIENRRLDVWTHNKTIQKAIESSRCTKEQKDHLRTLKIRQR